MSPRQQIGDLIAAAQAAAPAQGPEEPQWQRYSMRMTFTAADLLDEVVRDVVKRTGRRHGKQMGGDVLRCLIALAATDGRLRNRVASMIRDGRVP